MSGIEKFSQTKINLPVSNGKLKRAISQLNRIKDKKRVAVGDDALNGPPKWSADTTPLKDSSPDSAIKLWGEAKQRQPNQSTRKQYNPGSNNREQSSEACSTSASSDEDETEILLLDNRDQWMNDD